MLMLDLASAAISYGRAGERGPCVLLVQGAGAVGEGWRPQIDDLAADHQVAWLDNRGIGRSLPLRGKITVENMAADCRALLDHLGWERAHLVGHSMGGLIVQEVARSASSRVQSLALLSTLRRGRDATRPSPAALWTFLRMRFGDERTRWLRFAELPFPPAYRTSLSDEELLKIMRRTFHSGYFSAPSILYKQMAALWQHKGGDMAALRSIPTLIGTGLHDIVVPTLYSDELAAHLPKARLERFTNAGHGLPIQNAAAVNGLLREHFAAAEQAEPTPNS